MVIVDLFIPVANETKAALTIGGRDVGRIKRRWSSLS